MEREREGRGDKEGGKNFLKTKVTKRNRNGDFAHEKGPKSWGSRKAPLCPIPAAPLEMGAIVMCYKHQHVGIKNCFLACVCGKQMWTEERKTEVEVQKI